MLSSNIAYLRKRHGYTQIAFAEALHVTQSAVSHWETGRSEPNTQQLFQMARLFGMSIEELVTEEFQPPTPVAQKIDPPTEQEIDDAIAASSAGLTPDEVQRVVDFIAGIKAARRP